MNTNAIVFPMSTPFIRCVAAILALASPVLAIDKPRGTFSSSGASSSGIYANPNLRGVLIRANWSAIEPTPGSFTFTSIATQVANAKANGKPWSLAIAGGGTGSPAWLTDPVASGGLGAPFITYSFRGVPGYKLPLFWDSIVQDRLAQLASALAAQYNSDSDLKLVYVTQMTANGIEGHLQGVDMNLLIAAGDDRDGDSDVDAADFQINWIEASKQASRSHALAFTNKAIAFEVHDVNNTATIPEIIINDLWNDPTLGQRVGAAMWWISGKNSYQPALITVLSNFPGDIYGQVIGKSGEGPWLANTSYPQGTYRMPVNPPMTNRFRYEVTTAGVSGGTEPVWPTTINATVADGTVVWTCRDSRFQNGDYATVFAQAKAIGMRYIEPWEWEFKYGPNSANGEWDAVLADFNAWADATFGNTPPAITSIADQTTTAGIAVGPLAFTVGDAETDVAALTVTGSSSNTTLLPNANIVSGGSGSNRTVTLTPAAGETGTSIVTLTVSDGALDSQTSFALSVFPPLAIGGGDPPAPVSGGSYSHTFTVTGATGAVAWTLASGALPPGLTLSSDGVLSGTPTTPGTYDFTVRATDSLGVTGTQNVMLTVCAVLPAGQIGEVARLADGRVQLRLLGQPGQYFSLETSTNLADWTELGRNTFAIGEFIVTDTNAIGAERRFYRWRSLPKPCFTCTQVVGYSQVGAANGWYVRDGVFESIVGDERWQLLWNSGGGVDLWQDPSYVGWNNALVSPCPTNSATPDRVLLSISGPYGTDEAAWATAIDTTLETIKQRLPSARRIILQPVVGGLDHQTCYIGGTDVRASWQHKHIDNAIAAVVQARFGTLPEVVPGFSPEVQSCADYADTLGHFTPAGAVAAAQAIGQYYAGVDNDCCPAAPLPWPAGGP